MEVLVAAYRENAETMSGVQKSVLEQAEKRDAGRPVAAGENTCWRGRSEDSQAHRLARIGKR